MADIAGTSTVSRASGKDADARAPGAGGALALAVDGGVAETSLSARVGGEAAFAPGEAAGAAFSFSSSERTFCGSLIGLPSSGISG